MIGASLAFDAATAEPANSDVENHASRNDDPTSSGADDADEGARNSSPTSDPETSSERSGTDRVGPTEGWRRPPRRIPISMLVIRS